MSIKYVPERDVIWKTGGKGQKIGICMSIKYSGYLNTHLVQYLKRGQIPNGPVFECHLNT